MLLIDSVTFRCESGSSMLNSVNLGYGRFPVVVLSGEVARDKNPPLEVYRKLLGAATVAKLGMEKKMIILLKSAKIGSHGKS